MAILSVPSFKPFTVYISLVSNALDIPSRPFLTKRLFHKKIRYGILLLQFEICPFEVDRYIGQDSSSQCVTMSVIYYMKEN